MAHINPDNYWDQHFFDGEHAPWAHGYFGKIEGFVTSPPLTGNGITYVVAVGGSGPFAGHDHDIAIYKDTDVSGLNGTWYFVTPTEGCYVWNREDNKHYLFDGSNWLDYSFETLFKNMVSGRIVFADQYSGDDMVSKIHAAADDAGEGGIVLIPPGVYSNCVAFVPKSGITYIGGARRCEDVAGGDTTLITDSGETYSIYSYYKSRYIIRNITFRGAGWALTPAYFRGASAVVIDNVQFSYMQKVDVNYSVYMHLCNCEFWKMGHECLDLRGGAHNNMFLGCLFNRAGQVADDTYAAVRIRNSNTDDNVFLNCGAVKPGSGNQQKYGLQIDGGPAGNEIRGGRWEGKTGDWTDSGTDTVIDAVHS
jgi:hypothetical protein